MSLTFLEALYLVVTEGAKLVQAQVFIPKYKFYCVFIVLLEINVLMLFYLNVYFIFLKVQHEFERIGAFEIFLGESLLLYFFGFYFEDENNLVRENPLFYFISSSFLCVKALVDPFQKKGWEIICYKVNLSSQLMLNILEMRSLRSEDIFSPLGKVYLQSLTFSRVCLTEAPSKGQQENFIRYKMTPTAHTSALKEQPKPLMAYGAM